MSANKKTAAAIVIHPKDNVATATRALRKGRRVLLDDGEDVVARQAIGAGHKIATAPIKKGGRVTKYGETIGKASKAIRAGDHVHVHNVISRRGRR